MECQRCWRGGAGPSAQVEREMREGALTGEVVCPHRCWRGGAGPNGRAGNATPPGGPTCSRSEGGCVPHRHTLSLSHHEAYNVTT